jgi:NitT/TauT family transport system ATP-binding protein|uniref:ABC transporter ATP-binding protein n=1 Tax=Leptospirillum ferriphilum TaxID=178606 RepID=A0A7C3R3Z0_9BACT
MEGDPEQYPGISKIMGLLKVLEEAGGGGDLYQLGVDLHLELGEELQLVRAAESLGFVQTPGGDITLTDLGREILKKDINGRKKLIRERILTLPVFQTVLGWLMKEEDKSLPAEKIRERLMVAFPQEDPEGQFQVLVNWGRYAELFGYRGDREDLYVDQGD